MTRILLAEDQGLMRSSLATLLGLEPDLEVESVADGTAALHRLRTRRYDIALLDIQMPGATGLDIIQAIRSERIVVRPAIITTFPRAGYVRRAMDNGATGFLIKDRPIDELITAVKAIAAGQTVIDNDLAVQAFTTPPNPLSAREIDVLTAVPNDPTIADIAATLHLSPSTTRNYLSSAIQKLQAANRVDAHRIADTNGWL